MKTLILYGTTHGYAEDCSMELKRMIGEDCEIIRLDGKNASYGVDLNCFDQVVLGGSIYMGQIQKAVKEFCMDHEQVLCSKKTGLFLCCGTSEQFEVQLTNAFPKSLIEHSSITLDFGGELRKERMGIGHRMIIGVMTKATEKSGKAAVVKKPENIKKMAEILKAQDTV